jgi:hypothetical protein
MARQPETFIYSIFSNKDNVKKVWYVGRSGYPELRFKQHAEGVKTNDKIRWLFSKANAEGVTLYLDILERVPLWDKWQDDSWKPRESHWISHYRKLGHPLLNHPSSNGGECTAYEGNGYKPVTYSESFVPPTLK